MLTAFALSTLVLAAAPDLEARIVSNGPTSYEVDQDVVAQVLLAAVDGEIAVERSRPGFELLRAPPGSLLARLGLATGDVISTVGGRSSLEPDVMRFGYATLKKKRKLEIGIKRKNEWITMTYELRGRVPRRPPPRVRAKLSDEVRRGIERIYEGRYRVSRAALKTIIDDGTFARSARIVPSFKDGSPNGLKLFAIRRGSLFAELGLKNGDVVTAANGRALSSPDAVLALYPKLLQAKQVRLDILRRGRTVEITYVLR